MRGIFKARSEKADTRTHIVVIENMRFEPARLTVRVGDRVIWRNRDLFPHTATADAEGFDSGNIPANGSWTLVAEKRGARAYTCTFHPNMKGTMTVE